MTEGQVPMIRCVGAVVHDATGRLLMVRRATEPGRGRWSLPGGRVEPGETDAEAVIRELREETGLEVVPGELVGSVERPARTGIYLIFDYAAEVAGGVLRAGDDAAAATWASAAEFTAMERAGHLVDDLAATLREWNALPRA
jgi:8-oxo-dGTP diphosphatase